MEFKGVSIRVTAVLLAADASGCARLPVLLNERLDEAPGFFEGEVAVLDGQRLAADATLDLDALLTALRVAGVTVVGVRSLPETARARAVARGLAVLPEAPMLRAFRGDDTPRAQAPARAAEPARSAEPARVAETARPPEPPARNRIVVASPEFGAQGTFVGRAQASAPAPAPVPAPAPAEPASSAPSTAMVVERTLRSGQRVYAQGRDLVLLASVSPGAEVIADGSIHCYGALRGRALAGAAGDTEARIYAQRFEAELVSIGGIWRNFESIDPALRDRPVRVALRTAGDQRSIDIQPLDAA